MRPGAREDLGTVFEATLSPDKHMDAVRFAFSLRAMILMSGATAGIPSCRLFLPDEIVAA